MSRTKKGQGKTFAWLMAHVGYQGDDCLPWPFSKDGRVGRGRLGHNGKMYWAHRLMCELAHGEPPTPDHQAAHNCGKGHYGCVNPRHLEWKTNSENQLDRRKNGNMLRNSKGNKGSITPEKIEQIHEMRRNGKTQVSIGKQLGVSLGCVQYWLKYRADRGNDTGKIRHFSDDDVRFMREQRAAGRTLKDIAASMGRTYPSVVMKAARLRRA